MRQDLYGRRNLTLVIGHQYQEDGEKEVEAASAIVYFREEAIGRKGITGRRIVRVCQWGCKTSIDNGRHRGSGRERRRWEKEPELEVVELAGAREALN